MKDIEIDDMNDGFGIGRQFRDARRARGMTQKQLMALTGVHNTRISDFERGKKELSLYSLFRLAKGLGGMLSVKFVK
jgi:transcriptional regulator with XRE-family HTH domain